MEAQGMNAPGVNRAEVNRWVENAQQNGDFEHYAGKRHATRFNDGMLLQVTVNPAVSPGRWNVYMHNVSEGGFAFWSKKDVQARAQLWVRDAAAPGNTGWMEAWVTHCTRGIRGFLVGASFGGNPKK